MSQTTTDTLSRPDGHIAYERHGDDLEAPLVICVPGLGDLRGQYRFLGPVLVAAGYRSASMDVRGHGESATTFASYTPEDVGRDIVALIDELKPKQAFVLGNSMAGAAAVWAAAERPEVVQGIVLLGAFVRDAKVNWFVKWLTKLMFMRPWGAAAWAMFYKTLYPSAPPPDLTEYRRGLKINITERGRLEALVSYINASKASCEARLPEVKSKSLVVMGTKDPDFGDPAVEAQWICNKLGSELMMVEGAGHYPHAEMPQLVSKRIVEFLAQSKSVSHG